MTRVCAKRRIPRRRASSETSLPNFGESFRRAVNVIVIITTNNAGTSIHKIRQRNVKRFNLPLRPRAFFRCRTIDINDHPINAMSKNGLVKCENK